MKFGKSLSNQIEETLPEWRDKFLSYKELKKRLKSIEPKKGCSASAPPAGGGGGGGGCSGDGEEVAAESRPNKRQKLDSADSVGAEKAEMTEAEVDFVKLLEDELEKFNTFFVEKEEECIIRLKELQDRMAKAKDYTDEIINLRKEIVDFHGEMVLLENYSALNYTGLVKILKKYDKRTGALLRLPFIQKVLQQPFFTTDLLYKFVKECERILDHLFSVKEIPSPAVSAEGNEPSTSATNSGAASENKSLLRGPKELAEIEYMESLYMKSTLSALRVLKEIRSGSSTVSVFSLPPLQGNGLEGPWNKVPILEEVAK